MSLDKRSIRVHIFITRTRTKKKSFVKKAQYTILYSFGDISREKGKDASHSFQEFYFMCVLFCFFFQFLVFGFSYDFSYVMTIMSEIMICN